MDRRRREPPQRSVRGLFRCRPRAARAPSGFDFIFDKHDGLREELKEFVRFEAACCSFIDMRRTENATTIELSTTGASGAKSVIEAEFIDVSADEVSCGCQAAKGAIP